ncbi:MAG: preprotein translocase subunit SecY, partial [Gammaproteobacteria bacterium]|nr:preprotein translocase subunit SecY [Gammaproteobacteria bacterium]
FVLLGLIIYRLGSYIPVPGLDPQRLAHLFNGESGGLLNMFNLFSGGALGRLSVFALGVMPYISASIVIQLLTSVVPTLEQLKKEGEAGRRKINQYTRYSTVALAAVQAFGMSKLLAGSHVALNPNMAFFFIATLTLTTGTVFLMWLGEQMTERGIGNGISLIIFAGIVSGLPGAIGQLFNQAHQGEMSVIALLLILCVVVAVTLFVVFVERGQRQIIVNYAQRQQGRKMYAAQQSHLPFKINLSGVIPPIFASSIILFLGTIAQWFSKDAGWLSSIGLSLTRGQPVYIILYAALIIFFAFFYTALVFNPKETADNLKKSGAFIPGIRPGQQTAQYIDKVMTRLTFAGAIYLALVALLPEFLNIAWSVPFYFGGTSLLIIVVVLMDFISQVQSHLMSHQYESLLKKSNTKGGNPLAGGGLFG